MGSDIPGSAENCKRPPASSLLGACPSIRRRLLILGQAPSNEFDIRSPTRPDFTQKITKRHIRPMKGMGNRNKSGRSTNAVLSGRRDRSEQIFILQPCGLFPAAVPHIFYIFYETKKKQVVFCSEDGATKDNLGFLVGLRQGIRVFHKKHRPVFYNR
jgi:hypothetical protein